MRTIFHSPFSLSHSFRPVFIILLILFFSCFFLYQLYSIHLSFHFQIRLSFFLSSNGFSTISFLLTYFLQIFPFFPSNFSVSPLLCRPSRLLHILFSLHTFNKPIPSPRVVDFVFFAILRTNFSPIQFSLREKQIHFWIRERYAEMTGLFRGVRKCHVIPKEPSGRGDVSLSPLRLLLFRQAHASPSWVSALSKGKGTHSIEVHYRAIRHFLQYRVLTSWIPISHFVITHHGRYGNIQNVLKVERREAYVCVSSSTWPISWWVLLDLKFSLASW